MFGLSSSGKEQVSALIEEMFDKLALELIGATPSIKGRKAFIISSRKNFGLPELFVQAMANKPPNSLESDAMKGFLESATGYIDSLKAKTMANVTEQIDALARESKAKNVKVEKEDVDAIFREQMRKAKSAMRAIAEAEATKMRNAGALMNISRLAANMGEDDPMVFFIVVKDDVTCEECKRLHLQDDGVTPKVWRLSELSQGYHKRGANSPSVFGLHPHCRCALTYLSQGFGFNEKGRLTYKAENHNEYKKQRE